MSDGEGEGQPVIRVLMMPKDTNAFGTIFGGVILSQIDQAAAIEAHKHHVGMVVTVAMDSVEFKQPVLVGDLGRHVDTGQAAGRANGRCLGVVGAGSVFSGVAASDEVRVVPKVFRSAS